MQRNILAPFAAALLMQLTSTLSIPETVPDTIQFETELAQTFTKQVTPPDNDDEPQEEEGGEGGGEETEEEEKSDCLKKAEDKYKKASAECAKI